MTDNKTDDGLSRVKENVIIHKQEEAVVEPDVNEKTTIISKEIKSEKVEKRDMIYGNKYQKETDELEIADGIKDVIIDPVLEPAIDVIEFGKIELTPKQILFKFENAFKPDFINRVDDLKKKKKDKGYWFAGFETGLFISDVNTVIPASDINYFHKDYSKIRKDAEKNFWGQSLGITFGRRFKIFSVFSGLTYNRISGNGHYDFIYKDAPLLNPDNSIFGYNELSPADQETVSFTSSHTYTSFGVPIGLGIKIKEKGKNYFGVSASFQPTWLLNASAIVPQSVFINQTTSINKAGIKLNSLVICLGLNYQYRINSRYLFELNPYFKRNKLENKQDHSGVTVFNWYGFNGKLIRRF